MSVFRVKLNSTAQGLLDKNYLGVQEAVSHQRQAFVMGPNKVNRLLVDGATFTDCNYWKRFAPYHPTNNPDGCALEHAILEVVTDDGSVYSDIPGENTYPKVYTLSCDAESVFTDNVADILGDTGGYASFVQITNSHETQAVSVRLNGNADAVFTLEKNSVQIFNAGDLAISKIEVANDASGATGPVVVEILLSVRSLCRS
jgi:hypothetical protein